jgi:GGDEF domain-containing protein
VAGALRLVCPPTAIIRYPITASIGIVSVPLGPSFDPAERELIDDLVNVADTAMYAAKRAGGNQSRSTHLAHAAVRGNAA